jgi:hypothetical protein
MGTNEYGDRRKCPLISVGNNRGQFRLSRISLVPALHSRISLKHDKAEICILSSAGGGEATNGHLGRGVRSADRKRVSRCHDRAVVVVVAVLPLDFDGRWPIQAVLWLSGALMHQNGVYWCYYANGQTSSRKISSRKACPAKRNLAAQDRQTGRDPGPAARSQ